jgi:V/A-type H+-transporting ATPase subunit I
MKKLHLAGMAYEKDGLLNVLQQTGAAQITCHDPCEDTEVPQTDTEPLRTRLASVDSALEILEKEVDTYQKDQKIKATASQNVITSYEQYMAILEQKEHAAALIEQINTLVAQKSTYKNEVSRTQRDIETSKLYSFLTIPFAQFADSKYALIRLGAVTVAAKDTLCAKLSQNELWGYEELSANSEYAVVVVASHRTEAEGFISLLSESSFQECPYRGEQKTGEQVYQTFTRALQTAQQGLAQNAKDFYALREELPFLKTYRDRLAYELEKAEADSNMLATEKTFLLEAYVPKDNEEQVAKALEESGATIYYDFTIPTADDMPPTLLKNNPVVSNFESITNTYSPPNYREFDPNAVMSFFYNVFMGFIIGDMGYGILMLAVGGWLSHKKKGTGMGKLCGVFAFGGIFAILWGLLFNSLFGIQVLPFTVMPDAQSDFCTFVGVTVPSLLVIALMIGIVQLGTGYVCRAVQCFRRKEIGDGIFNGLVWAFFSLGVLLAVIGLVGDLKIGTIVISNLSTVATVGGIMAGVSLAIAVLTAGRKEKFLGKFTKGFGAAYGVISYASDILSYARLYGLMLSGVVIAQIISQYAIQFITGGNVALAILGIILMIVGHVFNIAMSLLGAYIHDARLQYVEFYGRFYEGEGELFAPLGAEHKYVTIK